MNNYKGDLSPEQQDMAINFLVNFVPYFVTIWAATLVVLVCLVALKIIRNKISKKQERRKEDERHS